MGDVLAQLGVDQTYFVQLAIFIILFPLLSTIFFRPFQNLFEARHQKTVSDKKAAEDLLEQANQRLSEYQEKIDTARSNAREDYDKVISEVKKEETRILTEAREEVKKITQDAVAKVDEQRSSLKKELEGEINLLARSVSEQLVSKKA